MLHVSVYTLHCLVAFRMIHVAWKASHVARRMLSSMGSEGGAVAERAARCSRAQDGGGVIRMDKGAVLFDGVAISGTEANVRAGGRRCVPGPMRVGGAGRGRFRMEATPGAARLCAGRRRRGLDERRGSHVQGRHDHQHHGGGAHLARSAVACLCWMPHVCE